MGDRTADNAVNHERTSTQGGASSKPTPANNAGGGKGWGDKGFFKGGTGTEGPGHEAATNPKSSMGQFLGLSSQKGAASSNFEQRAQGASEMTAKGTSCDTEDHSFMEHRPGCPETLPGWSKTKGVMDMLHGQGR
ncbi:hypothetical protein IFM58399_00449 [Aspergillus lentulus]|uniref:Conidiation-specific protein 10 n=2 Tax=Aspergillus lentulus TaxID=293939 RepID=A0ABQ1A161_ASPLE|nr:uncharacterized protein IFM58399_00449 [Aspergillus lentulus]GFF23866.1 hypothetical protein IFM58399_00449 [Aspergillus lentulus]GFF56912.1 hypothetical protein IFM62136_03256 [Aspergillus lentulus]GFF71097.1 hypothetical protein IFM60648_03338 [Aspergillus lentulus]GFF89494.1 hypothetical protein IFM47457_08170 [Aspergillus lentulus]GFG12326.1 hypothetical protein IFM61392_07354 [Aspergillus lentulus]